MVVPNSTKKALRPPFFQLISKHTIYYIITVLFLVVFNCKIMYTNAIMLILTENNVTERKGTLESLEAEIEALDNLPIHVAIIMDGNGRWAKKRDLSVSDGHAAGVRAARDIVKIARKTGVRILSLYTFSLQNWKRSSLEIGALMKLLSDSAFGEVKELIAEGVSVVVSGDLRGLPLKQRTALKMVIDRTAKGKNLILNLVLNYGGREEIVRAARSLARSAADGDIDPGDIDEEIFSKRLYTAGLPDPDLLIRTSGEFRLSNFLLWQLAYSEIYITETLWPDFDRVEFCRALVAYAERDRRFGGREE